MAKIERSGSPHGFKCGSLGGCEAKRGMLVQNMNDILKWAGTPAETAKDLLQGSEWISAA